MEEDDQAVTVGVFRSSYEPEEQLIDWKKRHQAQWAFTIVHNRFAGHPDDNPGQENYDTFLSTSSCLWLERKRPLCVQRRSPCV